MNAPLSQDEIASHVPVVRRYLTKMLRPDEIDDGAQSVIERALENLSRFRGESTPRAWILGIARNVGLEIARGRPRDVTYIEDGLGSADLPVRDEPTQEEELGRRQEHALALTALDGLRLDEKLALLVTYVDGVPGPEAAELLGVSFPAFRQRLSRARQALAERLDGLVRSGQPGSAGVIAQWRAILSPGDHEET